MTIGKLRDAVRDCKYVGRADTPRFMDDLNSAFVSAGASVVHAQRAADLAWEYGHSSGYLEVVGYAIDLCALFC
jgi:hypothetical protein